MEGKENLRGTDKLSAKGLLAAAGIGLSIIGISPLFVMKAVTAGGEAVADPGFITGAVSSVFWILTIIGTLKFTLVALQADNKGEGGIFALFALLKNRSAKKALPVMAGAAALLLSGIIVPSIAVESSAEGFTIYTESFPVVPVTAAIITLLFILQRLKNNIIGRFSGQVMVIWFLMIAISGSVQIVKNPLILKALSPVYLFRFIADYPGAFSLLGTLFLCVSGAESIFQELGSYGRANLRISWIFVKLSLILSFLGQGAWLMNGNTGGSTGNPFFEIIPAPFTTAGIIITVCAALIAGHSSINRSFTLVSEAVSMNFWPNVRILHPTRIKGQVYIPIVNWFFWISSLVLVFLSSDIRSVSSSYSFALIINMLATTTLLILYLSQYRSAYRRWIYPVIIISIAELVILAAVLRNPGKGIWFPGLLMLLFLSIMLGWYLGRKIKNRYISFANISDYRELLTELHSDKSVPVTATNLVYIIKANNPEQVESKVIYSILQRQPKRAETYWFLHVDMVDEPERFDYEFTPLIPGILNRVDFHLGFKVEPRINLYFREVLEDLENSGEADLSSSFTSLKKHHYKGDFKYILIDRVMLRDNKLSALENFILALHGFTRWLDITDERALHLDLTNTVVEKIPVTLDQPVDQRIARIH